MSYICSHGCHYTDEELEMGMSFATLAWLMEQEERAYNLEHDLAREQELARQYALGELDEWPWYADAPIEIAEPEVFGP